MRSMLRFVAVTAAVLLQASPVAAASAAAAPKRLDDFSSVRNDYNLSFGAGGEIAVFARSDAEFANSRIYVRYGKSSPLEPISFSDPRWRDSDPWLTPDGRTLYFISNRPTPSRPDKTDLDIWRSVRVDGKWSAPEHLGDRVNSSAEELGPELHGGALYFSSSRAGGAGGLDIYRAAVTDDGFGEPRLLPPGINSPASESDFTLSADARLASFWRMVDGRALLHVTRGGPEGWSAPVPLPDHINIGDFQFTPAFTAAGTLIFASDAPRAGQAAGLADLYEVDIASLAVPPLDASAGAGRFDPQVVAAIEAVAYDYVDGQLEGDAERVASSLHPDIAKRMVTGGGATEREVFPLRRMSADELVALTRRGALKTPREEWSRSVQVLDVAGDAAVVRVETPWFLDYFHMGRFGDRWLIVNALWQMKPLDSHAD